MSTLNLINKSPFERNCLESCLRLANGDSSILFIEDGVYAALEKTSKSELIKNHQKGLDFFVLSNDISARGLTEMAIIDGIKMIDYGGFVDLVEAHDAVHSWL